MRQKVHLSPHEIKEKVRVHLGHLLKSARDYDHGDVNEAVRMAVSLRALLHVGTRNGQAGIASIQGDRWHFLDTCSRFNPKNLASHMDLVYVRVGAEVDIDSFYQPYLDDSPTSHRSPFPEWWNTNAVLSNNKGERFTRAWIVRSAADQEGAHIDVSHDKAYHGFNSGLDSGWVVLKGETEIVAPGLLRACTRQIAHEALRTFRKCASDVFPIGFHSLYDELVRFPNRRLPQYG